MVTFVLYFNVINHDDCLPKWLPTHACLVNCACYLQTNIYYQHCNMYTLQPLFIIQEQDILWSGMRNRVMCSQQQGICYSLYRRQYTYYLPSQRNEVVKILLCVRLLDVVVVSWLVYLWNVWCYLCCLWILILYHSWYNSS